jgi:hypothetical protein
LHEGSILDSTYNDQFEINLSQASNAIVPTHIHPPFDGTQTSLDPLMLEATYLGITLVWIAGSFAIATIEVQLPSFLSTILSSIEMSLELIPRGHECAMCPLSRHK